MFPEPLIEADLARALERGELLLDYQPQVDARTGRVANPADLLGYRVGLDELLISGGGNPSQGQIGLRLSENGSSLIQFLVDFGGINQGK